MSGEQIKHPTEDSMEKTAEVSTGQSDAATADLDLTQHRHPVEAVASADEYTGFDAVVKAERKNRKQTFPPNSIKVPKPSNILIDIYGVISPWEFASELKKFAKENLAKYIREKWNSKLVKNTIARMREQIAIDRQAGVDVPEILSDGANEEVIIESAIQSIQWQYERKHNTTKSQIDRLCTDLWSMSYDNGTLKTHVYPEVVDTFNYWRFEEFIKIYSYASGTVEGQRQFLRASEAGDLNRYIANGLNSTGGYKFDSSKFRGVTAALREAKPYNLLYVTDDPKKAHSAIEAGLRAVVLNRKGLDTGKYAPEEVEDLTVVSKLNEIQFVTEKSHLPDCC